MIDALTLIGIGTGNPDHVTLQGQAAIRDADVILIPLKGDQKDDLAQLRRDIIGRALDGTAPPEIIEFSLPVRDAKNPDYEQGVLDWHDAIAASWQAALAQHPQARNAALLIWGDPSLYDSALRIAERMVPKPTIRVVPGITAIQALTAAHAITLNEIGAPVVITTGRQLQDHGFPSGANTAAIMLDGQCSFQSLAQEDYGIFWGAFVGMENQILRAGTLKDVSADIIDTRASARAAHGWIMDLYLLRRLP